MNGVESSLVPTTVRQDHTKGTPDSISQQLAFALTDTAGPREVSIDAEWLALLDVRRPVSSLHNKDGQS